MLQKSIPLDVLPPSRSFALSLSPLHRHRCCRVAADTDPIPELPEPDLEGLPGKEKAQPKVRAEEVQVEHIDLTPRV